jgi:ABC-type transport system involved in cytochrome c biogenesis permease subunit
MTGKRKFSWLLAILFVLPLLLPAEGSFLNPFRRMLIQENGRQKPLDTFARNLLKQFSGRSALHGQEASAWLVRVLFTPGQTLDDKIFLVNNPDVPAALGIPGQGRQRYSFLQIDAAADRLQQLAMQSVQTDEKSRSAVENEITRLYVNTTIYYTLLNAFNFTSPPAGGRPQPSSPGSELGQPQGVEAPILAVIPSTAGNMEKWLSPGEIIATAGIRQPGIDAEITYLTVAAQAFASGRDQDFSRAINAFNHSIQQRLQDGGSSKKISLEIFYNRLDPFFKAQLAYGLALVFLLLSLLIRSRLIPRLSLSLLLAGLLVHSFGLLARMVIMNRPPVTNLYETFVFVAWTGVLLGIILEFFQKKSLEVFDRSLGGLGVYDRPLVGLGILAGAVTGLLFLLVAGRYSLEGDTMGMLAAVLDSNLWLTTHVVTISIGYAGCVVAGIIGHVYIVHQLLHPSDLSFRQRTARSIHAVLAFGLVFTFIGTVMGGIWADQSWGRFWGWDPKENGALLIILWCAILLHARLAGMIGQLGMAVGTIGSIITVVLAWFGVNLLGLGMHSYGFTSGIARGLLIFVGAELIFITVALFLIRKNPSLIRPRADLERGQVKK